MEYNFYFLLILILTLSGILLTCFFSVRIKPLINLFTVISNAFFSAILSVMCLNGDIVNTNLFGGYFFENIFINIDALSAWFILIINFTSITGAIYGIFYMKRYNEQKFNSSLHWISYILMHFSLIMICCIRNSMLFLMLWEVMTISSFILIIFEHTKKTTLKAGINFLIQSHIGFVFLLIAFLWVASETGSYSFSAIIDYTHGKSELVVIVLFLCFFTGFAFKAGFVPFHTWLPYAHPAAPSHISGVMSGIIIKMGIYGILRILLLIQTNHFVIGFIILFISLFSGIYGVMVAIVQHNLKKLLAYHSIENIGIIGIGIGLGTIGLGTENEVLATLGFAGGILHTLNHSLFKSLLFYCAGNVYQTVNTLNIEQLGGLIKKLPHTSILFLISSLAICGLPPFNGFISEFLIYLGLFKGLSGSNIILLLSLLFTIIGLVMIGGLAVLCFTKAYGVAFLGTPRHDIEHSCSTEQPGRLVPMYITLAMMVLIGVVPGIFVRIISQPVNLFLLKTNIPLNYIYFNNLINIMTSISLSVAGFILLCVIVFLLRNWHLKQKPQTVSVTWGCGYNGDMSRMQYSANSFTKSYRKLAEPVLSIHKKETEIKGIFPSIGFYETHPVDKIEEKVIDKIILFLTNLFDRFSFLQTGNPQHYILYGIIFIVLVIIFPYLYDFLSLLFSFIR